MKLKKFFSSNIREISLIIVMIALSVFIEIRSGGNFFTLENISDMFTETAVLAITAVGMMMPKNRAMQKMGRQVTCAAEDAVVRAMDTVEKKLH